MINVINGHTQFTNCKWEYTSNGIIITANDGFYLMAGMRYHYLNNFGNTLTLTTSDITVTYENNDYTKLKSVTYKLPDNDCYFFRYDIVAYKLTDINYTDLQLHSLGGNLINCTAAITSQNDNLYAITITANNGYRFTDTSGMPDNTYLNNHGIGYRASGGWINVLTLYSNNVTSDSITFTIGKTIANNGLFILHDIYARPNTGSTFLRLPQGDFFRGDISLTPLKPVTETLDFKITLYDGYSVNTPTPYFRTYFQSGLINSTLFYFTKNNDNTELTYPIPTTDINYFTYFINFNLIEIVEIPKYTLSNMVRIYKPTNEELNGISLINTSRYIMNLYVLPFDITENISTEKVAIVLGTESSTQTATQVLKWVMSINGGTVNIPQEYENVYDYKNVEITIYIPFIGYLQLPNYLIGSYVNVTYNINLYEGTSTVYVTNNNDIILTEQKKVGYYLPFYSGFDDSTVSSISLPMVETHNRVYVKTVRKIPYPNNGSFGKINSYYGLISAETGYFEIENIQLSDKIPQEIQSEIIDIMKAGVFI